MYVPNDVKLNLHPPFPIKKAPVPKGRKFPCVTTQFCRYVAASASAGTSCRYPALYRALPENLLCSVLSALKGTSDGGSCPFPPDRGLSVRNRSAYSLSSLLPMLFENAKKASVPKGRKLRVTHPISQTRRRICLCRYLSRYPARYRAHRVFLLTLSEDPVPRCISLKQITPFFILRAFCCAFFRLLFSSSQF